MLGSCVCISYFMTCYLMNIIILSCYHLTPSMIYLTLWLSCLRESCLVIMELSATQSYEACVVLWSLVLAWYYILSAWRIRRLVVRGTLGLQAGPRCMGTTIRSTISSSSSSSKQPSPCLYMDVCVLGCILGHIPRYMSQTSNNNKRLLLRLLWTPVMLVMILAILVKNSCYDHFVILVLCA